MWLELFERLHIHPEARPAIGLRINNEGYGESKE
jgi:hypothetical protein